MRQQREFPESPLGEERDVLIIEAYVAKPECRLARRRIETYHRDYPSGFPHERVDRASEENPRP